jgi:signal peptidase II
MASPSGSTTDRPDDRPEPAIRDLFSHLRFWIVAGAVLFLDLWSKHWVFKSLNPNAFEPFIPDVIHFHRSLNDGAVFGSFTGQVGLFIVASLFALAFVFYLFAHSPRTHRVAHIALALILAGALGNLYDRAAVKADVVRFQTSDGIQATIIGIVVSETEDFITVGHWPEGPDGSKVQRIPRSGAVVKHQGVVRDFIKFVPRFPAWVPRFGGRDVWPWVFNVADASLVCGVAVLLLGSWFDRRSPEKS